MRSAYIIGGAGTGKSTMAARVMEALGREAGPHEDWYTVQNKAGRDEVLRGHRLGLDGAYLGRLREQFPGTDGLSRSTVIAGEAWLLDDSTWHPDWLLGEGATFATVGFLDTLQRASDMLLVHLLAAPATIALRCSERGSNQAETFLRGTVTRSTNSADRLAADGARVLTVDTDDPVAVDLASDIIVAHLTRRG
jgi:gluconate kinase